MNKTEFLNIVENKIERASFTEPLFYKAWNAGELIDLPFKNMLPIF